jgi:threonyl-tRNA synthetase
VVGIPVAEAFGEYLDTVTETLRRNDIRVDVDHSDDRMQKKIRTHTTQKVPFLLLAGAKDVDAGAVSFRFRDGSQINGVPVPDAVDAIVDWVRRRVNASPTAENLPVRAPIAAAIAGDGHPGGTAATGAPGTGTE